MMPKSLFSIFLFLVMLSLGSVSALSYYQTTADDVDLSLTEWVGFQQSVPFVNPEYINDGNENTYAITQDSSEQYNFSSAVFKYYIPVGANLTESKFQFLGFNQTSENTSWYENVSLSLEDITIFNDGGGDYIKFVLESTIEYGGGSNVVQPYVILADDYSGILTPSLYTGWKYVGDENETLIAGLGDFTKSFEAEYPNTNGSRIYEVRMFWSGDNLQLPEEIVETPPSYQSNVIYQVFASSGAGLGIFLQILSVALPVFLIGIAMVLIIMAFASPIKSIFEKVSLKGGK